MGKLLAIADWYSEIKIFVNTQISDLAFASIIALIAICILGLLRYVVKNGYNVSTIRKNIVLPIVLAIILGAILVFLCTIRYI